MTDQLYSIYPWIKAFHVMAVISWMAGLFYLPRLFVYHTERAGDVAGATEIFQTMEDKLMRVIMRPAMFLSWGLGLFLVALPGVVDWSAIWPWSKGAAVIGMTWFHYWLAARGREFSEGRNRMTGRQYRLMNEVPTILMAVIVLSVILKF